MLVSIVDGLVVQPVLVVFLLLEVHSNLLKHRRLPSTKLYLKI